MLKTKKLKTLLIVAIPVFIMSFCVAGICAYAGTYPFVAQSDSVVTEAQVYICTGPQSKRYHKTSSCRGLKSCSKSIKKVGVSEAKELGRTPCGICYK